MPANTNNIMVNIYGRGITLITGSVIDKAIKEYITNQGKDVPDDDFHIGF